MRKASPANPISSPLAAESATNSPPNKKGSLSLWLWVIAGYIFLSVLWTIMFKAVGAANVESVPLVTKGAQP